MARAQDSDFGDGRDFNLAGCSRVSALGREQSTSLHRGDALRVPHDRRLCDGLSNWMDAKGFQTVAEIVGKSLSADLGLQEFQSVVQRGRAHRREQMHQVQPLLCGVQRHGAPVYRPEPRVRRVASGRSRRCARRIAWAAGFAITCARWSIASRWRRSRMGASRFRGTNCANRTPRSPRIGRRWSSTASRRAFMFTNMRQPLSTGSVSCGAETGHQLREPWRC